MSLKTPEIEGDGELSPETRQAVLDRREELEVLAESDNPASEIAAGLLRAL